MHLYSDDMFVEMAYSLETVERVGNMKHWLTSEYQHDGLSVTGETILDKLIAMNRSGGGRYC